MPEKTKRKAINKPFALIRKIGSKHFHDKGNVLHIWKYKHINPPPQKKLYNLSEIREKYSKKY